MTTATTPARGQHRPRAALAALCAVSLTALMAPVVTHTAKAQTPPITNPVPPAPDATPPGETEDGGERARGRVFLDANANGVLDQGETGIAGVSVSNGRDVTVSDTMGRYEISLRKRDVLFITKPSGYAVPLSSDNLPQFYYIHDPDGTPEDLNLRYEGVRPTGPLPASIDFPLTESPESEEFTAILFADTQPQTFKELEFIRDDVVGELIGTDAAFGITAGDIFFDDMSMTGRFNRIIGRIGIPWYNVPGNHELNFLSPDDDYSLETFKRVFGPTSYSFAYGQAHFIVMDDVYYEGTDAAYDPPHPRGAGRYRGFLTEEQLGWLEQDLAQVPKDRLIVLVMHIPLMEPRRPDQASVNVSNKDELFSLLLDRPHVVSFAGHTHTSDVLEFGPDWGFEDGQTLHHHTLATVSGSWWSGPKDVRGVPMSLQSDGVPNGYSILTVSGTDYSVRYKAAGLPADHQMRITFDSQFHRISGNSNRDYAHGALQSSPVSMEQLYATDLVVNLFYGGPRSTVSYRITGGPDGVTLPREPVEMVRTDMPDPTSVEMISRFSDEYKSWVSAANASHIWTARLPRSLEPGIYTITVTGTDAYGAEHTGHRVLEVTAP